ncbi:MAG TPA: hypothetical protein VGY48_06225 [Vicinamibacterales bacterium]|nr:hypothetical protein [Vicinamibacterales bacterium]
MRPGSIVAVAAALLLTPGASPARAESPSIDLVLNTGRPLRVVLDRKISVKRVGQPVTGTIVEPVYAYDRIVIPAGTKVRGHIAKLTSESTGAHVSSYAGGDFSPPRQVVLKFDTLVLSDGREMPIDTTVTGGVANVQREVAGGATKPRHPDAEKIGEGAVAKASDAARQAASDAAASVKAQFSGAMAAIKQPGRMSRLKDAIVSRLPFHPQYLAQGLVYDAELMSPVSFGSVEPTPRALNGTAPAPDSVLTARLATTLDSSKTPRGTPFEAVLTEPVFSADHQLILPEGTTLAGEVTYAKEARAFQRNGQLRFLFETVHAPGQESMALPAALFSVDASKDDHVAVDEEGGTKTTNSKTRFIAPTLGVLALRGAVGGDGHRFADPDGDGSIHTAGSGIGSRGVGGFLGFSVIGIALSQVSRPAGIALAAVGVVRTLYTHVVGKGREVTFLADTPIQVRLAPGPSPQP